MPDAPVERPVASRAWPLGAAIFTLTLGLAFVAYALDVTLKARGVTDWMMIVPAAAIGIVALAGSLLEDLRAGRAALVAEDRAQTEKALLFMSVLVAYVAVAPYGGFDVATFAFLALTLVVQGERDILPVLAFSTLATLCVVGVFVMTLGVSLPVLLPWGALR